MASKKKFKQRVRERMDHTGERYTDARMHLATKFPVAQGSDPKVFHLYYCRQEGPSHDLRDRLNAAGIPFFLRDLDRDPHAFEETEALGIEGIPCVAVCVGKELLVEPDDRRAPMPMAALRRLHDAAYFEEGRWSAPRELALDAGFVVGSPVDRSDERPDDYLDEDVDIDSLSDMLDAYALSHDLKNVIDAVGYVAPPIKIERAELIEELFDEGEISGMDIAKNLPRKAVDLLLLPLSGPTAVVGNLPKVRERLARMLEARYRRGKPN